MSRPDRAVLFRLATSFRFERAVRSSPAGERAAWRRAARYVAGTVADDAIATARSLADRGVGSSIDYFGELVSDRETAERVASTNQDLAAAVSALPASGWLSVDLSHLGLDVDPALCLEHLSNLAAALPSCRRVQVGAEDHRRTQAVLDCVVDVAGRGLADRLGATVQANLRRSPGDIHRLAAAGVHVRLVKGAYVEPAALAWPHGEATDLAYLRLARKAAEAGAGVALATHDPGLRERLLSDLGDHTVEQLLGVRPDAVGALTARGTPVRFYIPYGQDWFRYWMRRLAESRGA